jgi:hypothetical protein
LVIRPHRALLKDFGDRSANSDWAVISYAGHGLEMNGPAYLLNGPARTTAPDLIECIRDGGEEVRDPKEGRRSTFRCHRRAVQ